MPQYTDALGNPIDVGDDVVFFTAASSSVHKSRGRVKVLDPLVPDPRLGTSKHNYVRESQLYSKRDPTSFRMHGDYGEDKLYVPIIEVQGTKWNGQALVPATHKRTLRPNNGTLIVITKLVSNDEA